VVRRLIVRGAVAMNVNPFDESCLSKDVLVPSVAPADLKSVWAMKNEFEARHPGQRVSIGVDFYKRSCSPQADVGAANSDWHGSNAADFWRDAGSTADHGFGLSWF
jgi:hypothetical protein